MDLERIDPESRETVTAGLRFVALTGADESVMRDGFRVRYVVQEHDRPGDSPPSWLSFVAKPTWPYPGSVEAMWVGYAGATPVAWYGVYLQEEDNLDVASVEIEVHPDHRGRGIGQEILRRQRSELLEAGRSRLLFESASGGPGERFLRAAGARLVVADTQRRLDLTRVDVDGHDALLRDAQHHATDYELVRWVGSTPAELREDAALLHARMSTDPPLDDLSWEPERFDADKVVTRDRMMAAHGMRVYATAARHQQSRAIVGITTLVVFSDVPEFGDQWETIVLPEHRGHRLGVLLKVGNLRQVMSHEPRLEAVDTWNADSNTSMLAVNVPMGFTPVREGGEWELTIQDQAMAARA